MSDKFPTELLPDILEKPIARFVLDGTCSIDMAIGIRDVLLPLFHKPKVSRKREARRRARCQACFGKGVVKIKNTESGCVDCGGRGFQFVAVTRG